jgi:hypothetical protein
VGSYCCLSAAGSYRIDISGRHRYVISGMGFPDRYLWQPKWMSFGDRIRLDGSYTFDGSPLGWFYCPMIWLDQKYVHQAKWVFDDGVR